MRNLRCWLLGHEWIATHVETTAAGHQTMRVAQCPRCGMSTGFVDGNGGESA